MKNLKHRNVIRDMKEKILSLALDYDNIVIEFAVKDINP